MSLYFILYGAAEKDIALSGDGQFDIRIACQLCLGTPGSYGLSDNYGIGICSWQMYRNALRVCTLYLAFIMSQDDGAFSEFLPRLFLARR
jgi:hypothetical protein